MMMERECVGILIRPVKPGPDYPDAHSYFTAQLHRLATHWDDCWKAHPDCAYWKGVEHESGTHPG